MLLKSNTPVTDDTMFANETEFKNMTMAEGLKHVIATTQENCKLGNTEVFQYEPNDIIGVYTHLNPEGYPSLGVKASYVVLSTSTQNLPENTMEAVRQLGQQIAMQVVALMPKFKSKAEVPNEVLDHERRILKEGLVTEFFGKKSEDAIEKILNSKLNSWFEDNVLEEQNFVIVEHDSKEGKAKVKEIVSRKGKELSLNDLKIKEFKLFI